MIYNAPIKDMLFLVNEWIGIDRLNSLPDYEEVDIDLIEAVLEEAGKFASNELLAINREGDEHGARFDNGNVIQNRLTIVDAAENAFGCGDNIHTSAPTTVARACQNCCKA